MGTELFHADSGAYGWTDRHNEPNSRFWQFCERAYKLTYPLTTENTQHVSTATTHWLTAYTNTIDAYCEKTYKHTVLQHEECAKLQNLVHI